MKITDSKIIKEYGKGLSAREVGRKLDTSDTKVLYVLKRNKVKIRKRSYTHKKFNEH